MSFLERAVAAAIRGDEHLAKEELLYCDGPARYLRPIAEVLATMEPVDRETWLNTRIDRLQGQTPLEVLEGGDPGRFISVSRALPLSIGDANDLGLSKD